MKEQARVFRPGSGIGVARDVSQGLGMFHPGGDRMEERRAGVRRVQEHPGVMREIRLAGYDRRTSYETVR
ncbi:MAG: hypothetical protein J4G11_04900 [Acidimicrobiia bacterium]|nr:hypothetical protein [Acidimicrobiia bacterium]